MTPKKNATISKQPEDSSMAYEESEDMYFWLSRVENLVNGFVSKGDLEKRMQGSMKTLDLVNL